jgi:hypothetical protein
MVNGGRRAKAEVAEPVEPSPVNHADRQLRSLVLSVDLVGSRRIWPAQVGWAVGRIGSRRVQSDRPDDQRDDQGAGVTEHHGRPQRE